MRGLSLWIALMAGAMTMIAIDSCRGAEDALHISVVGDRADAQYQRLAAWLRLDDRVQREKYHEITTDTAMYIERYAPNVEGLPTVRVQRPDGVVIYEKHGDQLPASAGDLHESMNIAVLASQILPWRKNGARPLRDKMRQCCPLRRRQQQVEPEQAEPEVEEEEPSILLPPPPEPPYPWWRVLVCVLAAVGGLLGGAVWQAVEMYQEK